MARHHPLDSLDADRPLDIRLAGEWTLSFSPPHIKSCTLPKPHVALIDALVHALDWLDLLLPEQLILGAPAFGDIPDSGVFNAEDVPASQDEERDLDHKAWNALLVRLIMAEANRADKQADLLGLWVKTQSEVEKGLAFPIGS
eukprot:3201242-Pleurochrysis_carterae.AAC.1